MQRYLTKYLQCQINSQGNGKEISVYLMLQAKLWKSRDGITAIFPSRMVCGLLQTMSVCSSSYACLSWYPGTITGKGTSIYQCNERKIELSVPFTVNGVAEVEKEVISFKKKEKGKGTRFTVEIVKQHRWMDDKYTYQNEKWHFSISACFANIVTALTWSRIASHSRGKSQSHLVTSPRTILCGVQSKAISPQLTLWAGDVGNLRCSARQQARYLCSCRVWFGVGIYNVQRLPHVHMPNKTAC